MMRAKEAFCFIFHTVELAIGKIVFLFFLYISRTFYYFIIYFNFSIDATLNNRHTGRLINHDLNGNLNAKLVEIDDEPFIVFFAKRNIYIGDELLYDYNDRDKETIKRNPWLKSKHSNGIYFSFYKLCILLIVIFSSLK